MRISERPALAAAFMALLLAACDPATLAGGGAPSRMRLDVAGEALTIAAPAGFCIDRQSTTMSADGAFVLMSDCALLGARGGARAPVAAALTASVSAAPMGGEGDDAGGTLEDLQDFAATSDGRAAMGRSGRSSGVRILDSRIHEGVLYVLVEDRGPTPIPGVDRTFWRAFLEVDGRMVALSELNFDGAGIGAQEGLNRLASLARAIRAANPA